MGRTPTNRGRIGIQPYPVDDLKLQGYIPKTLYVPDDIPISASIALGQYNSSVKTLKTDEDGNLYITYPPQVSGYVGKIVIDNQPMVQINARNFYYDIIISYVKSYTALINITDISDNTALYSYDVLWFYNETEYFRFDNGGPLTIDYSGDGFIFSTKFPGGTSDHTRLVINTSTDQTFANISGFIGYLL